MADAASVEKITSKILDDAERRSREIIGEAEEGARERVEAARRKGEVVKKELVDDAHKEAEQVKRKMISEGKIKARTIILEAKERLINRAFELAEKRLEGLPDDKSYPQVLFNLARDTCIAMGGGELKLLVRKEDEKLLSKELKKLEEAVKKATGRTAKLAIDTAEIGPGVVVKRMDGAVEIDSTFTSRIELLRPELRLKAAEVLFK